MEYSIYLGYLSISNVYFLTCRRHQFSIERNWVFLKMRTVLILFSRFSVYCTEDIALNLRTDLALDAPVSCNILSYRPPKQLLMYLSEMRLIKSAIDYIA